MDEQELKFYYAMAYNVATQSPDLSTQNGAILISRDAGVIGKGFNGPTKNSPPRLHRPEKYTFTEHAERAAIYRAAKDGNATDESTMVALWASCADCARGIVEAGVSTLYRHAFYSSYQSPDQTGRMAWQDSIDDGDTMMREAGVKIVEVDLSLNYGTLRFNGEEINL